MFIPIGDDNSLRRRSPVVIKLLIAANIVFWFLQLSLGESFTAGFAAIPFELSNAVDLTGPSVVRLGSESVTIPQAPGPRPIYLTLLTAMFMHGSWAHIIGNMLYLGIFGDQIEDLLGRARFLFFYIMCGIAASFAHILGDPGSVIPSLGASGAIAGVLGAYLVNFPKNRVRVIYFQRVGHLPAAVVLGFWIIIQFVSQAGVYAGQHSGVAYLAHIGGFIAGIPLYYLLRPSRDSGWHG